MRLFLICSYFKHLSAKQVLVQINQFGISSTQARRTYTSEAAHLKLNAPLGKDGDPMYCPWPLHIRSCMLAASAADAAGKEFWERISNDELRGSETFKTDDEMASRQEQLVLEKIETVCNSNSNANEVLSSLRGSEKVARSLIMSAPLQRRWRLISAW